MRYFVYAVRDLKTGYLHPTLDQNDATAMRNFAQAICKSDTTMNFAPGDYQLYCLGEFDSDTGTICPLEVKALVADGAQVKDFYGGNE